MTTLKAEDKKKTYHHGDLRHALLEGALEVLEEVGVQGLSLRGVAARAGVSHAAPYRHFADKESLLAALAQDGFRRMYEQMMEATASAQGATARLVALGSAYVAFARAHPTHFRLMFGPHMQHEGNAEHECARQAGWRCYEVLIEAVQACQQAGELPGGDPAALAVGYWSLAQGMATLHINGLLHNKPSELMPALSPEALTTHVLTLFTPLGRGG